MVLWSGPNDFVEQVTGSVEVEGRADYDIDALADAFAQVVEAGDLRNYQARIWEARAYRTAEAN